MEGQTQEAQDTHPVPSARSTWMPPSEGKATVSSLETSPSSGGLTRVSGLWDLPRGAASWPLPVRGHPSTVHSTDPEEPALPPPNFAISISAWPLSRSPGLETSVASWVLPGAAQAGRWDACHVGSSSRFPPEAHPFPGFQTDSQKLSWGHYFLLKTFHLNFLFYFIF